LPGQFGPPGWERNSSPGENTLLANVCPATARQFISPANEAISALPHDAPTPDSSPLAAPEGSRWCANFFRLARKMLNPPVNMKMHASENLTRPQFLRMTPSPLLQLLGHNSVSQHDPPAVRAAWLRLYWEIVGKPKRSNHRKH